MRRVKLLMIGRHLLTWLWLLLWLTASPGVHARVVVADESAPAFVSAAGPENQITHDLHGLHYRSVRASRRFDFSSTPTVPLVGVWSFEAGVARHDDTCNADGRSEASLSLTSGWQFLLRTALSPRAPSFVS